MALNSLVRMPEDSSIIGVRITSCCSSKGSISGSTSALRVSSRLPVSEYASVSKSEKEIMEKEPQ